MPKRNKKNRRRKKTCFVIMGYGVKTDYETGRQLDLDKTFENIIKPVFNALQIDCFRGKDINLTGVIDTPMYEWLLNADIVVADLSTLNANALYELGVRHALNPFHTIVISEKQLKYPFDLSHTLIDPCYEHLGTDIGVSEARRFKKELRKKVIEVLKKDIVDSPVYTYLTGLKPPTKLVSKGTWEVKETEVSLSTLIDDAERAKQSEDFQLAKLSFEEALKVAPYNSFLIQRLALVTYKYKKPNEKSALNKALNILSKLEPETSTDPETLGLCGAIHKRLFKISKRIIYLNKAISFYEKGFYVKQDYYNGINLAYLLTLRATITRKGQYAITDFLNSHRIREKVIVICNNLMKVKFKERGDKNWVLLTLAEAYLGLGQTNKMNQILKLANKYSEGSFDINSFNEQTESLKLLIQKVKDKYHI